MEDVHIPKESFMMNAKNQKVMMNKDKSEAEILRDDQALEVKFVDRVVFVSTAEVLRMDRGNQTQQAFSNAAT